MTNDEKASDTPETDALVLRHTEEMRALREQNPSSSDWSNHSIRQVHELLAHARRLEAKLAKLKAFVESKDWIDKK